MRLLPSSIAAWLKPKTPQKDLGRVLEDANKDGTRNWTEQKKPDPPAPPS